MIGGHDGNNSLSSIIKLNLDFSSLDSINELHIDNNGLPIVVGQWKLLPQKLKKRRHGHMSFLIPDHLTKCY